MKDREEIEKELKVALSWRDLPADEPVVETWNPRDPKRRKFSSFTWHELKTKKV